jgi:biopolymer transport protein ExbD
MRVATGLLVLALLSSIARADAPKCPVAAGRIVAHGEWLAITGGARCFAPNKDGKPDPDVLGAGLQALAAALPTDCTRSIQLAADSDTSYQNVVTTMDLAIKAGLADVQLTDPSGLSVKIDDSDALERKARHCAAPAAPAAPAPVTTTSPNKDAMKDAPVLVITPTDVSVDGTSVGAVKTLAKGKGVIPALTKALAAHKGGDKHTVIVQADVSSSVALINRVIATTKQAGYDNVLFAVKNK